jgi:hypothetical protein
VRLGSQRSVERRRHPVSSIDKIECVTTAGGKQDLQTTIARLEAENSCLRVQLEELRANQLETWVTYVGFNEIIARLSKLPRDMRNTLSWKVTAPLRMVRRATKPAER